MSVRLSDWLPWSCHADCLAPEQTNAARSIWHMIAQWQPLHQFCVTAHENGSANRPVGHYNMLTTGNCRVFLSAMYVLLTIRNCTPLSTVPIRPLYNLVERLCVCICYTVPVFPWVPVTVNIASRCIIKVVPMNTLCFECFTSVVGNQGRQWT